MGALKHQEQVPQEFEDLVKPHVASFDYFIGEGLQTLVAALKPVTIKNTVNNVSHRVWFENPTVGKPQRENYHGIDNRLFPRDCRESGTTYKAALHVDVCYQADNGLPSRFSKRLGLIPIMVKSSACYLRHMSKKELVTHKEEATEFGGYFVCNGIERIIRCLINQRRHYVMALRRGAYLKRGANYTPLATMLRCVRPDQSSATVRCHLLKDGNVNLAFTVNRAEYFIPLGVLLKCFLEVTDKEIYEKIMSSAPLDEDSAGASNNKAGGHQAFVAERAELLLRAGAELGLHTRAQCLAYLGSHFRVMLRADDSTSDIEVGMQLLEEFVFIHLVHPSDKFNLLLHMVHKLYALANGKCCEDNPDANTFHEILLPGHLLCKFMKEKLEDSLSRFSAQVMRDLRDKPEAVDLLAEKYVRQVADKAMLDVGQMMEYMLATGNLVSRSGLDLSQSSGFTVVAEKLNFFRYLSHFRSVHRGAYFMELRTTTVRKLLPESWGFLCPVHTPDGGPCGLLNHFTHCCRIVTHPPADPEETAMALGRVLSSLGMLPATPGLVPPPMPTYLPVMMDGRIIGSIASALADRAVTRLRDIKAAVLARSESTDKEAQVISLSEDEAAIPYHVEVVHIPPLVGAVFPGIHLYTDPARMIRPVRGIASKAVQYIGSLEQLHMDIRCPDGGAGGSSGLKFSHEELNTGSMLSVIASLTPYSDYNQSPRNMYQCQMGKQTMGTPAQALAHRTDTKLYRIQTPQTPLARTEKYDKFHMDEYPSGTNAIVAVLAYTGYDMEDAMIINKSSMERGFGHGTLHKTEVVDLRDDKSGALVFAPDSLWKGEVVKPKEYEDAFGATLPRNIPSTTESRAVVEGGLEPAAHHKDADHLDVDGLPYVGALVWPGESTHSTKDAITGRFQNHKLKGEEIARVESVTLVGTGGPDLQRVNLKYRFNRNPVIGDKFSSRHGQKGVLSQLWPDIDMPYCETTGMRPDVLINPHAFPSRMTIGMLVESMASKAGALHGEWVDATPFQTSDGKPGNPIEYFGKKLEDAGYHRFGGETMISGVTGEEFPVDIFIGSVYYQRLRHMVSDKFQVRSTGPINPLTKQPVKGRKLGGGIRLGEMERDSLLAHGAAYLLHDRLHTCSDYCTVHVCTQCGSVLSPASQPPAASVLGKIASAATSAKPVTVCRLHGSSQNVEQVAMPFVFKYLIAELAAMNIKVNLDVK